MTVESRPLVPADETGQNAAEHPLSPLTPDEIRTAAGKLRSLYPGTPDILFKAVTLEEPPKAQLVPYLTAEHAGTRRPFIKRRAFVSYCLKTTGKLYEAVVDLNHQIVEHNILVGAEHHAPVDSQEIMEAEETVFQDEGVKAALRKLQLPEHTKFICDPWTYGSDGVDDDRRMLSAYIYMRDPLNSEYADSNHYAFPLPVLPVLDAATMQVIRIDTLPTGPGTEIHPLSPAKIHPPREYTSEHQKLRTGLKPLRVTQPEGASFTVTQSGQYGETVEWQKWFVRIGFNQREGVVLHNVRYDGRDLFYRIALSDMNIPYADPRSPFHRKAAFDLGDVGAGVMANNLKLGCDCLGAIYYVDAVISDIDGNPDPRPNAMCIHEQDGGLLWKHTNYRTGRAAVVRNRELVIQSIITVANYEYILAFIFNQAGELTYEVRATGVVSTQPIDEGTSVPWGTVVHPGVLASHHQHILSLRIDPAIDGHENNTFVTSEVRPMPMDDFNPHGVGYTVSDSTARHTGSFDLDFDLNRSFKIANPSSRNPINGHPVAYKIQAPPFQKMLAHPKSFHHRRAEFADHNIYLTRYRDDELYAGGKYTNQSRGGHGVRAWANRHESLASADGQEGGDIVVWVQFGLQHIVRIEDWPVMPVEISQVSLKPVNFFDGNPALDVAPSDQGINRSVEIIAPEKHLQARAKEIGDGNSTASNSNGDGDGGKVNGGCACGEGVPAPEAPPTVRRAPKMRL